MSKYCIGGSCSVAGTMVKTDAGWKPIESVVPGDKVLSRNEVDGEMGYRRVTNAFVTHTDELVTIRVRLAGADDGAASVSTITGTLEHPIWSVRAGTWVGLGDLRFGDRLRGSDGHVGVVTGIDHVATHGHPTAYRAVSGGGGRDQLLTALTPSRVLEGRQALGQRLSPVTVNNTTATLRRALGFALDEGWIAKLPFKGVKKLAEPVFSSGWWDAREVSIALKAAAADRHQPTALLMVALGVYLGLRKDELVNLGWEDLQLDRRDPQGAPAPVCTVRCTASWMPKSRRQRTIPINTELRQILLPHRKPAGYVLEPEKKRAKRGGTKRGYRFDCTKVWNRVRKAAVALGAKHIRFHDMRHTFASNQLISGTPAIKVARWLGHSSVEMVEKVYGHLLAHDDDINAVSYRFDEDDGKVINFPGA